MKTLTTYLIVVLAIAAGILEVQRKPDVYGPFLPDGWVRDGGPR